MNEYHKNPSNHSEKLYNGTLSFVKHNNGCDTMCKTGALCWNKTNKYIPICNRLHRRGCTALAVNLKLTFTFHSGHTNGKNSQSPQETKQWHICLSLVHWSLVRAHSPVFRAAFSVCLLVALKSCARVLLYARTLHFGDAWHLHCSLSVHYSFLFLKKTACHLSQTHVLLMFLETLRSLS